MSQPRNREQTEQRILAAVGEVLAREGFTGIGVNAIAKQAGVDKVLIYRYFGGLPALLAVWGRSGQFWPRVEDLIAEQPDVLTLPPPERLTRFFSHFIDALRRRPLTLEVLAAELVARNELTAVLEEERERWGQAVATLLGGDDAALWQDHIGATTVLIAGVQYLLLRARKIRRFGAYDLHSDASWDALKASIAAYAHVALAGTAPVLPAPEVDQMQAKREVSSLGLPSSEVRLG